MWYLNNIIMLLLRLWRNKNNDLSAFIGQNLCMQDCFNVCVKIRYGITVPWLYDIELFTDRVLPVNYQFSKIKVFIADDWCTFLKYKTESQTIQHVFKVVKKIFTTMWKNLSMFMYGRQQKCLVLKEHGHDFCHILFFCFIIHNALLMHF